MGYSFEDYTQSTAPFEELYQYRDDPFELERHLLVMSKEAAEAGVRNFKKIFGDYMAKQRSLSNAVYCNGVTEFEGQELELETGRWRADEYGITTDTAYGEKSACSHPILPVMRLVNIDTGEEKLRLAFRKGKQWRHVVAERKTIASANSIINLASCGIGVTSENAKLLVQYLHDIENYNYDLIPEKNSVSRLGWIDGAGFSPYVDDLVFDGELSYKSFFESVQEHGCLETWLETARKARKYGVYARVILAASFASVLVQPLGCLPFFVHLWGGTEVGKTVGLMLAASVWASPDMGRYIHTFNSTSVGREKSAGFVNSLPLIFDELQIISDRRSFDNEIYMLSEGIGRSRGAKTGGIQKLETWRNCILTSGEMPLTGMASGGGAVNRIIDVECKERLFEEPREVANLVRKNYGHAGKLFVGELQKEGRIERAGELFKKFQSELSVEDTTEKQSMAAALLLTADALATEWIFGDGAALTVGEIKDFLQTKASVCVSKRAYEYLCEYVVGNRNRFCGESTEHDVWGRLMDGDVAIIRSQFDRICKEQNFSPQTVLSWLRDNGKLHTSGRGYTKTTRINGVPCNCVVMQMIQNEDEEFGENYKIP